MKKLLLSAGIILSGYSFSQVILNEDFEGGLPGTWTQTTLASDGGFLAGTANTLSSQYWAISNSNATGIVATNDDECNCNKSADRLISPALDLSSVSAAVVTVDVFFNGGTYSGATETARIDVSTDGGVTWTLLQNLQGAAEWTNRMANLTSYVGNSDVRVSFLYNDNSGWLFGLAIDNFKVEVPLANDARLDALNLNRYALVGTNNILAMTVTNVGSSPITSLTIDWNDGNTHVETITVNIAPFATVNVNHPTAINYATAIERTINVNITNVNGGPDDDPSNNTGSSAFNTVSQLATKAVLIEEGTGTWCGWCPRGKVAMAYMTSTYPNFIGIMVHNSDPMALAAYDNAANFGGYPSANVDRVLLDQTVSQNAFISYYNARKDLVSPADLSATVSGSATSISIDASATFYTEFAASNYRLGVILYENGVTGTTAGYNQANYYSGGASGPMGGYENLPDPVPASQMVYDYVGRALLGGYNGQTGSVPSVITDGLQATHTFNYTVPLAFNAANIEGVVVLIDQTNGEIVNAHKFSSPTANLVEVKTIDVNVYPNPATEVINIAFEAENTNYSLNITDVQGRVVHTENYNNLSGGQVLTVPVADFTAGNYFINLSKQGETFTRMFMIK
jgi:hypothetical protein